MLQAHAAAPSDKAASIDPRPARPQPAGESSSESFADWIGRARAARAAQAPELPEQPSQTAQTAQSAQDAPSASAAPLPILVLPAAAEIAPASAEARVDAEAAAPSTDPAAAMLALIGAALPAPAAPAPSAPATAPAAAPAHPAMAPLAGQATLDIQPTIAQAPVQVGEGFAQALAQAAGAPSAAAPAAGALPAPPALPASSEIIAFMPGAAPSPPGLDLAVPADPAPPPPISMRSPEELAEGLSGLAVRALKEGGMQATLKVTPEALGPLRADIAISKLEEGASSVSMTLTLANPQALEAARESLEKLQQSLAAAGMPGAQIALKLGEPVAPSGQSSSMESSLHSGSQGQQGSGGSSGQSRRQAWGASEAPAEADPGGWLSVGLFDRSA